MSWRRFQSECWSALRPTGFRQATGLDSAHPHCAFCPGTNEATMSWTDERVEQLKQHWTEGKSASQIASLLGHGLTRNAVIGKVHRLGLAGRAKSPGLASSRPRSSQPSAHRAAAPRIASAAPRITRGATALAIAHEALE